MTPTPVDVLVVGAGTTGLALALQAHDLGARVRVVERREEAFRPSRALIVHPRTLEVLRPLGVTGELLARGDPAPSLRLRLGRREPVAALGGLPLAGTASPTCSSWPRPEWSRCWARRWQRGAWRSSGDVPSSACAPGAGA